MIIRARHTTILFEGWCYLGVMVVIFLGALLREINLLMVLFGLLAGALFLGWRSAVASLRGLKVMRRSPEMIGAGEKLVVEIEAENPRKRRHSWTVVVDDSLLAGAPSAAPQNGRVPKRPAAGERRRTQLATGVLFGHLPAGQSRRLTYETRIPNRGVYEFGPLRVSTAFPFGLVRRTLLVDQPGTLTVSPRLGRLTSLWTKRRQEAAGGSRQFQRPHGLREGDYHSLRDWRPGDSRRWIHWRTTARRGELMVRQFEQDRNYDLMLLVDPWQPPSPQAEHLANVERAVSFAATVAAERCTQGANHLALIVGGAAPASVRGPASAQVFRDVMRQLAVAAATEDDGLPSLLSAALDEIRPGTDLVLVSTRPIELSDTRRFGQLWADPQKQAWIGRAAIVDASSDELSAWFEPNDGSISEGRPIALQNA